MSEVFTVKKWQMLEESFDSSAAAIARAVELINPTNKNRKGLARYLSQQLGSHFAIEYADVVVRHLIDPYKRQEINPRLVMGGAKRLPTFTDITPD